MSYCPQRRGSPLLILKHLAEKGQPVHRDDVYRLINDRHESKGGVKEALATLREEGLIQTQMVVITPKGLKALRFVEEE